MPLPAESVPAILPLASGFTELALPIRLCAFEAVDCRANSTATANTAVHLWLYIMVASFVVKNVTLYPTVNQPVWSPLYLERLLAQRRTSAIAFRYRRNFCRTAAQRCRCSASSSHSCASSS